MTHFSPDFCYADRNATAIPDSPHPTQRGSSGESYGKIGAQILADTPMPSTSGCIAERDYGLDSPEPGKTELKVEGEGGDAESETAAEQALLERYLADSAPSSSQLESRGQWATSSADNTKLLIKRVPKSSLGQISAARREIAALSAVSVSCVPRLVEWAEFRSSLWLVVESRGEMPLKQYMQATKPLTGDGIKSMITQLFSGVAVVFNAGFAHLHITDETLFVDDTGQLTITNFDYAYEYATDKVDDIYASVEAKHGSGIYTAPEVFANIRYNGRKAVIWSCGVVVYFICTGQTERLSTLAHPAFDSEDPMKPKRKMSTASQQALKVPVVTYPDRFVVPAYARDIISKMLQVEPRKRAELIEVAAKVPKEFVGKETRPLMELAWQDYKSHVGPLAGLSDGAPDDSSLFSFGGASVFSRQSFSQLLPGRRKSSVPNNKNWTAGEAQSSSSRRRSFFG